MASNNQRAPSAPPPPRWSNESKKNSKEHQQQILGQVNEMFESILEPDIILSVVQNCKWKLQPSIDALIMLSENAEVPLNRNGRNLSQKKVPSSSSSLRMSKNVNSDGRVREEIYSDKREYKSNLEQDSSTMRSATNSFLNLNDKELLRQQEEFRKFELLRKDLTEKGFVCSENENVSKPSYSQENNKIPHTKLQQFGAAWSNLQPSTGRNETARLYYCSDVENSSSTSPSHINPTTNQLWANTNLTGQKKSKETNNQFDNLFGSKLQFCRDLPSNKIENKGTIPKNCKTQTAQSQTATNVDPAIISARNVPLKDSKTSNTKGSPNPQSGIRNSGPFNAADYNSSDFSHDFEESQQQVTQFDSNYDVETKTRVGGSKTNLHKGETESLCGLKVQYRLPGLENSSDDDADVVIEDESTDYQTQIPSLMSINVCQFISSSTQSPPKNTHPEMHLTNTPSPPRSPQHNTYDDKLKSIISAITDGHKVLIILRGLPGSGKTHLAHTIVRSTVGGDPNQFVFSSDDYFTMLGRGVFQFVRSKLSEAHSYNQKRVASALKEGVSPVIVANTNTQSWEMQPYVVMGVQNGYIIQVLEPNTPWSKNVNELAKKNTHGISKDHIRQMMDRYEHNITGPKLIEQFSLRYSAENVPPQPRKFPFFKTANEAQNSKNEKQKPSTNNKRNRRRKRNPGTISDGTYLMQGTSDSSNYLLSDSDKNMKHVENSPRSKNSENTLDNIVSNALMSENDALNKSLVDYCIETDSGDELDSDRVPAPQENCLAEMTEFNLLGENIKSERNDSSFSLCDDKVHCQSKSKTNDAASASGSSSASSTTSSKKISNVLHHQNLGAIGSERKGSVTAIDYENLGQVQNDESSPKESTENVLSQCWDFTLLINGKQIHSAYRPIKKEVDFRANLMKDIEKEKDSEHSTGVIITEIIEDSVVGVLDEFKGTQLAFEDPDTVITKIINKMDASEQETSVESKTEAINTDFGIELAYNEPVSSLEDDAGREEAGSSIGSIFNIIKKSLLGLNSEVKPVQQEVKSEESIMKFKHQTNDNSLSENDAFENEKSHREPSIVTHTEKSAEEDSYDMSSTIVDDSLSQKLSELNSMLSAGNSDKDLREISELINFDTLRTDANLEFLIDDNLSGKLSDDTVQHASEKLLESDLKSKNCCIYSNIHSDDVSIKNVDEVIDAEKCEKHSHGIRNYCALGDEEITKDLGVNFLKTDSKRLAIEEAIEQSETVEEMNTKRKVDTIECLENSSEMKNDDSTYDILTEAVNRIISKQEQENRSQLNAKDGRNNSSNEDKSESSEIVSSYLIPGSANIDKEGETILKREVFDDLSKEVKPISSSIVPDLSNEKEVLSVTNTDKEIISGKDRSCEKENEIIVAKDSGQTVNETIFLGNEKSLAELIDDREDDSSIEECCECCEDCGSWVISDPEHIINEDTKAENKSLDKVSIDEMHEVPEKSNDGNKSSEIIDNINQVTWKESPFPVSPEPINSLTETVQELNIVSKSDSSTNTSNYDFNVLYVGGTSEPEYKVLKTQNRTINSSPSLMVSEKPPLKLMLHKSSMTCVVDILSGEESLEAKTEDETIKDLHKLIEMFPNVPREDITEIYSNLCSCNFNWAMDMLLDGMPEQVTKYSKIETPKIGLVEKQAAGSDPADLESQNSTPRKERLDKLKQQSSSLESHDSDSKSQQHNPSPRKKKDKNKVSEETLELKRQIEEKMIINEASYNPHILRVKRWKSGEPDVSCDFKEDRLSQPICVETEEFELESQSPKSSESTDEFTEDDIEPEETMELNLGQDFIKVLENEFGNLDFQFPGGIFPVIQIKKSMAQQLHALWIESMEQQLNAQQEQLDKMIEKDAEYARSLEQEEARSLSEPVVPNLPEIMDMEMALAIYHNDLKKQRELETPNDMASRLTRQLLHDMFPDNEPETLDEILKAHNGNFKETVDVLEASTGHVVNCNNTLKKQKSLIDRAKKESIQCNEEELDSGASASVAANQDPNYSSNSNLLSSLTYDDALGEAQASRKEAQRQLALRNENFNKATEAFRKGNRDVAGYYSQMAKLHSKKMELANSTAASAFLAAQDYMMNTENTLDLHYLYVAEALQALEVFLDYHISKLNEGNKNSMNLYIITGRGARSHGGLSRIKPAISKKLASKNIRYMEDNPGCLKVVLHRRNNAVG